MSIDRKIVSRKVFLMKTNIKLILLFLLMQGICYASFAQTNIDPCGGGDPLPPVEIPPQPAPIPVDSAQVPVLNPVDPNEIIGLEGYNAPENTDTLRWVSATQTLAYTVCFENDAELAMAAASKDTVNVPLHEKLNYAIFEVGSTYIRSSKSSVVASLTCVHDIMSEIQLAHCVRGGMVRCADGRVGKRRAASENVPLPVTSSSPPFFFPFCLLVRNTIPRNVTTLSGISSVWQQTSKKCSLT